jgi:hypothetical protein
MRSFLGRLARRPIEPLDRRFDHIDRRMLDMVDTIVRHLDIRIGELDSSDARRQAEAQGLLMRLQKEIDRACEVFGESTAYVARALRDLPMSRAPDEGLSSLAEAYALRALATLLPGAAVIVEAGPLSPLALSLASLGYRVTTDDTVALVAGHPLISAMEGWDGPGAAFDAGIVLTEGATESMVLSRLRALLSDGAPLVLAVPFESGKAVADRLGIEALLEGLRIKDCTTAEEGPLGVWSVTPDGGASKSRRRVALVTAISG